MAARAPFTIGESAVAPGTRAMVKLPISVLSNQTPVSLLAQVVHGARAGPVLFVSAAVHGDEIIGVEIIRRLLNAKPLRRLRGTLIAIPIVNAFGFITHSRYLPDRRDLNRSFPGAPRGSLAAQLAHLFMREIVSRCEIGIDLHSAGQHRVNLPQIRIAPKSPRLRALAEAFGAPIALEASLREGSLRQAGMEAGVDILVYEAGEALRFDEFAVRAGVTGVLRVMRRAGMLPGSAVADSRVPPAHASSSHWLRAPEGGVVRAWKTIGAWVDADEVIAMVSDPFGVEENEIRARGPGLIIGRTNLPVVNQGDALFHVAEVARAPRVSANVDRIESELSADPMFDEDEIL